MTFDPTITLGNVLTIATLFGAALVSFVALRERLFNIEQLLARQDERLNKAEDSLMAFGQTLARLTGFCESHHR